jgi:hypothetical protein
MKSIAKGKKSNLKIKLILLSCFLIFIVSAVFYFTKFNPLSIITSAKHPIWKSEAELIKAGTLAPVEQIVEVIINYDAVTKPYLSIVSTTVKDGRAPTSINHGKYQLVLVGAGDNIMSSTYFDVETTLIPAPLPRGQKITEPTSLTRDKYSFSITLKFYGNAQEIKILDEKGNIISSAKNFVYQKITNPPTFKSTTGDEILKTGGKSLLNYTFPETFKKVNAQNQTPKYLNIVIVGNGFTSATMNTFHDYVNRLATRLFTYEPFKTRASQIRISYIDNTIPLDCSYFCGSGLACDYTILNYVVDNSQVPHDAIYVLSNDSSFHGSGSRSSRIGFGTTEPTWMEQIFVHELGHVIGSLSDEYGLLSSLGHSDRNCYYGPVPNPLWKNIIPDSSYYSGCASSDTYRTSPDSIMNNVDQAYFNTISQYFINEQLDLFIGIKPTPTPTPTPPPPILNPPVIIGAHSIDYYVQTKGAEVDFRTTTSYKSFEYFANNDTQPFYIGNAGSYYIPGQYYYDATGPLKPNTTYNIKMRGVYYPTAKSPLSNSITLTTSSLPYYISPTPMPSQTKPGNNTPYYPYIVDIYQFGSNGIGYQLKDPYNQNSDMKSWIVTITNNSQPVRVIEQWIYKPDPYFNVTAHTHIVEGLTPNTTYSVSAVAKNFLNFTSIPGNSMSFTISSNGSSNNPTVTPYYSPTPTRTPTSTPTPTPKPTLTPTPKLTPSPTPLLKFSCTKYSLSAVWGTKAKAVSGYPDGWFNHGAANGQFFYPKGIDSDSQGNIYVADSSNYRIQKISSSGLFLTKWGSKGTGNGQFSGPINLALDASNNVYVLDSWPNSKVERVQKFDSLGKFLLTWGQSGTGQSQFNSASNIEVDKNGYVYVSEMGNSRIQKFTADGKFVTMWGSRGSGNGQFINPRGMAFDSVGRVYVADSGNHRIQIFDPNGVYLSQFGSKCDTGQNMQNGTCTGKFFWPVDVDIDSSDSIYVLESENNRVQKFNKDKVFITTFGSYAKSIGTIGAFRSPSDITLNPSGNIFVADFNRDNIQKFSCQ